MKTAIRMLLGILCTALIFCSPAPHEQDEFTQKGVPAINARVWLAPFVNNSNIASIEGWPDDSLQRTIVMRRFDKIGTRLLAELRRCEKYGLYTMVDDSNEATLTMEVTFMPFDRNHDTVKIPVEVKVRSVAPAATYRYKFSPWALAYRDMREKNPFHYVGLIMMNYTNGFPYKTIARILYKP